MYPKDLWMSRTCACPRARPLPIVPVSPVIAVRACCSVRQRPMTSSKAPPTPTQTLAPVEYADRGIRRGTVGRSPHPAGTQYTSLETTRPFPLAARRGVLRSSRGVREWVGPVLPGCPPEGCSWGATGRANLHYALFEGSPTVFFPEREVTREVTEFTDGCLRGERKFLLAGVELARMGACWPVVAPP